MTFMDMTQILHVNQLICVENESGKIYFCGYFGDVTMTELKQFHDRNLISIYPESYGKYCGFHGITFVIDS